MIKRVLIIGYVWPEPSSSAAGVRMLQLIQFFIAQGWSVVFGSAAQLSELRANLAELGVEEKPLVLNCQSFNEYVAALQPDVVLFDRFFTEEQFGWRVEQACPKALRILDTEDLHCLRQVREKQVKTAQKSAASDAEKYSLAYMASDQQRTLDLLHHDDTAVREIAAIFRCDLSLMISQVEIHLLQDYFSVPAALLFYLPLTASVQVQPSPEFSERAHFMSIGNFRHAPNWDAVLCLKHCIWPLIRTRLARAELHIYGAYLPPKASALHNPRDGFYIRGRAQHAHAVIMQARVCLAPLRFGAGIKGKLLDAMCVGTPSVTTRIGAEAMQHNMLWGGSICNSDEEFADAAVALHEQPELWQAAQANGKSILHKHFVSDSAVSILCKTLEELLVNITQHRRENFIGTMLRHHSHKSTQYMSQWIEAKNR